MRRLQRPGQATSESTVQTAVVFSQGHAVASRNIVETHGKLHDAPVEGAEDVEHFNQVVPSRDLIVRFAPSQSVLLGHRIHLQLPAQVSSPTLNLFY